MAAHHGRDQWQQLTLAATNDGTVTGLKVELLADMGAYPGLVGGGVPILGAFMYNAIYKFPAYQLNFTNVFTNKTLDRRLPRRRPAGGDVRDRAADGRARRRGRRRPPGDPRAELDQARGVPVHHRGRPGVRLRQLRGRHREGDGAVRVRRAAGRAEAAARVRRPGAARDRRLDVHRDVRPGPVAGARLAEVRRWRLGARSGPDDADREGRGGHRRQRRTVKVTRPRSASWSPTGSAWRSRMSKYCTETPGSRTKGYDTYGSRSLVVGGEAIVRAADKVIEKAKPIAAHLLEASVDDLEFAAGRFSVRGTDQGMALTEIALATFASHNYPEGIEPGIDAEATFDPDSFSFPHGTHLCAMEVDTETGEVKIASTSRRDIGNIINPLIVGGQVHGAGAGHRSGTVGGSGLRRRRDSRLRVVRRLPPPDRGRHDQLRHRPHDLAVHHERARHQGRRRGRAHRLDPRGRQRGRRRGPSLRRQRHHDAVHARTGVEGDQPGRLRWGDRGCGDAALR